MNFTADIAIGANAEASSDIAGFRSDAKSALADAEINNSSAEGAPQQQVVNGWAARDLSAIQVGQTNDVLALQASTNRLVALVAISLGVVIAILSHLHAGQRTEAVSHASDAVLDEPPLPPVDLG